MDTIRVGSVGTYLYINVLDDSGVPYDVALGGFSARTLRLRRPNTFDVLTIANVPAHIDPLDGLTKLRVVCGLASDLTLSGDGNFVLRGENVGVWVGEVELQLSGWIGKSELFPVFALEHKLGT